MELWLDLRDQDPTSQSATDSRTGVDCVIGPGGIQIEDGRLISTSGEVLGGHVSISDPAGQAEARGLVGSVDWLLVECSDWKMIPLENLIADAGPTPTRIAAVIQHPGDVPGAAFALEVGVDALVLPSDDEVWAAGQVAKSQRLERSEAQSVIPEVQQRVKELSEVVVTEVSTGPVGDRVCIDFLGLLELGEGLVVGSSSSLMGLIHGETIESGFVPPRPFRVNAGPVHSYTLRSDGRTCYLSEVQAGDDLLIFDAAGRCRSLTVGRVKIENRPLILLGLKHENAFSGNMFVQQAETVRMVQPDGDLLPVTELKIGDIILARLDSSGRHVGRRISSKVEER